ncbi:hypothetical protein [Arthrobacter monumenti]
MRNDDGANAALLLADAQIASDLRTYVTRARAVDDGGIRLQAAGRVLAAYVCMMQPKLLGESTPTILGLRTMGLARPAELDVTVPLAAVSDRLARLNDRVADPVSSVELAVPPMSVNHSWSGVSPPRSGWSSMSELPGQELIDIAKSGIQEVAEIVPVNPGALIVNNARGAVWGRSIRDTDVPAGAAFAAYGLGFLQPDQPVQVFGHDRWLRLSSAGGHVLVRPAVTF